MYKKELIETFVQKAHVALGSTRFCFISRLLRARTQSSDADHLDRRQMSAMRSMLLRRSIGSIRTTGSDTSAIGYLCCDFAFFRPQVPCNIRKLIYRSRGSEDYLCEYLLTTYRRGYHDAFNVPVQLSFKMKFHHDEAYKMRVQNAIFYYLDAPIPRSY